MKTIGAGNEFLLGQSLKSYNYQNLVCCDFETISAVPPHGLTVHQVSTRSMKTVDVIWCTVISKLYGLHHFTVYLSTMFQPDWIKTAGGVIQKSQVRKLCCTVTLKVYENSVYCNLAAILHIFILSNNIQITA